MLACAAVGLDRGLGIVHNDAKGRQSMALDLIEPVRPEVEGQVLDMLASRTFRKSDFSEDAEGSCAPASTVDPRAGGHYGPVGAIARPCGRESGPYARRRPGR